MAARTSISLVQKIKQRSRGSNLSKTRLISIVVVLILAANPTSLFGQEAQWATAHPVGSTLPGFKAKDSDGMEVDSIELGGPNGMLLAFNRSTVW